MPTNWKPSQSNFQFRDYAVTYENSNVIFLEEINWTSSQYTHHHVWYNLPCLLPLTLPSPTYIIGLTGKEKGFDNEYILKVWVCWCSYTSYYLLSQMSWLWLAHPECRYYQHLLVMCVQEMSMVWFPDINHTILKS